MVDKYIVVGRICKPYGIFGWTKIISFTVKVLNIFNYTPWILLKNNIYEYIKIESWKFIKNSILVKIEGIKNREEASKLINCQIFIKRSQFPVLNEREYYRSDILECDVINIDGSFLGKVVGIIETGSNDVLIVKNLDILCNSRDILIPFLEKEVIMNVDIQSKIIKVIWNTYYNM